MSFVIAATEMMQAAAQDLAGIGSSLDDATAIAAVPTTGIAAAGADEVSAMIAQLFGGHGQQFQALAARAATFHQQFVSLMSSGADEYLTSEIANAGQMLGGAVNGSAQPLSGLGSSFSSAFGGLNQQVGSAVAALENGVQEVSGVIAGVPAQLQALETSAQAQLQSLETSVQAVFSPSNLAAVGTPYQTLASNTSVNLQSLETSLLGNPSPLLNQIFSNQTGYAQAIGTGLANAVQNQIGYAQTIGTGFVHAFQNIPAEIVGLPNAHVFQNIAAEIAGLPATIQTGFHALSSVNPAAFVQQFMNNQMGYAQTISTSVGAAAHDFTTGLQGLPGSLQTAFSDLAAGNTTGALNALGQGFDNLFITGFNTTNAVVPGGATVVSVTPGGALGDLLPILSIPGQMAQNFANLFPAGSMPAHLAQNFANLVQTVTDLNLTSTASFVLGGGGLANVTIDINTTAGAPLVAAIDALGGPVNALSALGSSAQTITSALQTGNLVGAVDGLLDAPANVVNGFLNGQTTLPLSLTALGFPTTLDVPLDGILVPAASYGGSIPELSWANIAVTGTPIGGLLPDLLTDLPADLAAALGGPLPPVVGLPF